MSQEITDGPEASEQKPSIEQRITQYLSVGGLFNPEMMEHDKVRDLLMDCRDEVVRLNQCLKAHQEVLSSLRDWS